MILPLNLFLSSYPFGDDFFGFHSPLAKQAQKIPTWEVEL
jgi:hypothetical protein